MSNWRSIITGDLSNQITLVIQEIAQAINKSLSSSLGNNSQISPSMKAELAIFYAYLAKAFSHTEYDEIALALLSEAMDGVAESRMALWLYGGFTGVGWTIAHLQNRYFDASEENPNESIDELLLSYLKHSPWQEHYDLISGLVGLGVYALEGLPKQSAHDCLTLVIERLTELAEITPQGTTWFTPPHLIPHIQKESAPNGYYNLGLAHGVPGVIGFLARVCQMEVGGDKARSLLESTFNWLLKQKLVDQSSEFPHWLVPNIKPSTSRLAWCYGDISIAVVLLSAAQVLDNSKLIKGAISIAQQAAKRDLQTTKVVDMGLCHGAAGLGHLFNRFFQATQEPIFKQAAQSWFERTLTMRRTGEGITGFPSLLQLKNEQLWVSDASFLTGASGIGLALLAAITDIEPNWDRLLLVSLSPI